MKSRHHVNSRDFEQFERRFKVYLYVLKISLNALSTFNNARVS